MKSLWMHAVHHHGINRKIMETFRFLKTNYLLLSGPRVLCYGRYCKNLMQIENLYAMSSGRKPKKGKTKEKRN